MVATGLFALPDGILEHCKNTVWDGVCPRPRTAQPVRSSAIIGLRRLDHLQSQIADIVLCADILDAINAIAVPSTDLAAHEKNDTPPALLDPSLRR